MVDVVDQDRRAPRRVVPAPVEDSDELQTYWFAGDVVAMVRLTLSPCFLSYEIFIRELIANAMDAMAILKDYAPEKVEQAEELFVRITPDPEKRTLIIEDFGTGMTSDELVEYLGTVGKSGSAFYMEYRKMTERSKPEPLQLVGRFGIGFYSVFRVVDYVRVISKSHLGTPQVAWTAAEGEEFRVQLDTEMEHGQLRRGTKVICHLKQNMLQYVDFERVEELVFQHSEMLRFPVKFGMVQMERRSQKRRRL